MTFINNISKKAFYIGFFFSILWDLYHPIYGKIFDIIGYFFIVISLLIHFATFKMIFTFNPIDLIWKIPIFFISIYSALYFPLLSFSVLAGLSCSILLPIYFKDEFNSIDIYSFVKFLFYFLFFTQLFQITLYFITGYNLDFGGLIGFNNSRNEGGDFFRASGILAEANAIVVTQSLLFIILHKIKKNTNVLIVYLISLIISFSMLGIGIAFLVFLFLQIQNLKLLKFKHILIFIFVILFIIIIFNQLGYLKTVYDIYSFRLDSDSNDISLYLRLFRPIQIPGYELIIPHSYDIENEIVPSNAYYIGLYFWGLFFIILLVRILKYLDNNYLLYLVFLSILLSYQMYSSLLFWIFISFLISHKSKNLNHDKKNHQISTS